MELRPQEGIARSTAKLVLGAFAFLLFASFLVMPCMPTKAAASALFSSAAGPQACQEQKLFKPIAAPTEIETLPAVETFRFLVALSFAAIALAPLAARSVRVRPEAAVRIRAGTLPFATSDPPRLPAFGALRDA